jgi:hypothetical protein
MAGKMKRDEKAQADNLVASSREKVISRDDGVVTVVCRLFNFDEYVAWAEH